MKQKNKSLLLAVALTAALTPTLAYCSVETSLEAVRNTLIDRILPLIGAIGLVWAAFSFVTGNANARAHLLLAMIGAGVGFGAPAIIDFIRSIIH